MSTLRVALEHRVGSGRTPDAACDGTQPWFGSPACHSCPARQTHGEGQAAPRQPLVAN